MRRLRRIVVAAYHFVAALMVLALFGCATVPAPQVVVSRAEALPPVRIPVLLPCVTADQVPQIPTTPDLTALTDWQIAVMARRKLLEWTAYAVKADSLLAGCVKQLDPPETTKP